MNGLTRRTWLPWAATVVFIGLALAIAAWLLATRESVNGQSSEATVAVTGAPVAPVPVGSTFTVNIEITSFTPQPPRTQWGGYNVKALYPAAQLQVNNVAWGGTCVPQDNWASPAPPPAGTFKTGCFAQTSTGVGIDATITFQCLAAGQATIHLVTTGEDSVGGTTLFDLNGANYSTATVDGSVTCGAGPAEATPTSTLGTPTPTPPPTGPTSTPTPLPPGMEVVALASGCNLVASTYPDGTPSQTIASSVEPPGILASIWKFGLGTWVGYSPEFPEVSDLTEVDFLDAVFICVDGPGAMVRPIV